MKPCPTSNMNRSKMWGFEVGQILTAFCILALSNVALSIIGGPLILSWLLGGSSLIILRIISAGQKSGHLELLFRYISEPHIFCGHKERGNSND